MKITYAVSLSVKETSPSFLDDDDTTIKHHGLNANYYIYVCYKIIIPSHFQEPSLKFEIHLLLGYSLFQPLLVPDQSSTPTYINMTSSYILKRQSIYFLGKFFVSAIACT